MTRPAGKHRLVLLALIGALAFALWTGCASTVTPPARVDDPITVSLLSTGRHAGVLLPCPDGRTVEYGYGDWGWYALMKNDWWRAPATVLWPNQGTLGRRYIAADDFAAMGDTYGGGTLQRIAFSRERSAQLLAKLDAQFAAGGAPHFNATYDMWFVKHPKDFWGFHDCHDEVADWLRDLGCSVPWALVRTGLKLEVANP